MPLPQKQENKKKKREARATTAAARDPGVGREGEDQEPRRCSSARYSASVSILLSLGSRPSLWVLSSLCLSFCLNPDEPVCDAGRQGSSIGFGDGGADRSKYEDRQDAAPA